MKLRSIVIVFLVSALAILSSCASVVDSQETNASPDGTIHIDTENLSDKIVNRLLSSRWAAEISQEQKGLRIFEEFIENCNNRDTDGILAMFSEYAREESELKNQIDELYSYIGSIIESYDSDKLLIPSYSESTHGMKKGGVRVCTEIAVERTVFHIEVHIELRDDLDANNEGIQYIYIAKKEDYEETLARANEDCYSEEYDLIHGWAKWPTGIYINELPASAQSY